MTIAIIGAGVMGETILAGLLDSGVATSDIVVAEKREARIAELHECYAVVCTTIHDAVSQAVTVFLVVKPQDVTAVLAEIAPVLASQALVISLAAGITTARLEQGLPDHAAVVRVMPNTPALLKQGMSAVSAGSRCSIEQRDYVVQLMSSVGKVVVVEESLQDAVTAVSGSGPAYIFYIAEAMSTAAKTLGLDAQTASTLVLQTIFGAATMLQETGVAPEELRRQVSSPGGTTVAAINTLDAHGVREAFQAAMQAAHDRSIELGQ